MHKTEEYEVTFTFMVQSMSAYDAVRRVQEGFFTNYQLAKAFTEDPHHEIQFHMDEPEPGEPMSPVIVSAELSTSGMYAEFRFKNTPVWMTIPAMSTVTLGWLERRNV